MNTETRVNLIAKVLEKLNIVHKPIATSPFFENCPGEVHYVAPGPPFRYSVSCIISLYHPYVLVGTFSKNFNPMFTSNACTRFLHRNHSEQFKCVQFNSVLHGVFTTLWVDLISPHFGKYLITAIKDTFRIFVEIANELELNSTIANEWFLASGLEPTANDQVVVVSTGLWRNQEGVSGKVVVCSKSEGIYVKMSANLSKSCLKLIKSDHGSGFVQKFKTKKERLSLSGTVKEIASVLEMLDAIKNYFRNRVLSVISNDTTQYSDLILTRSPIKADSVTLAKLVKPYKTIKKKLTAIQIEDFIREINPKVRKYIITEPVVEVSGASFLIFEGKRWHAVGKKIENEEIEMNVSNWLYDIDVDFVNTPFKQLYYVRGVGFRFIPVAKSEDFSKFEIKEENNKSKEDVLRLVLACVISQLKLTDKDPTADIIAELPLDDMIEFSRFENKNLSTCIELGKGGFGSIYLNRYRQKSLEGGAPDFVDVALKVIKPEKLGKPVHRNNLLQEYRILKTTYHNNVIKVHGYTLANGNLAIVMDYCKNRTLSKFLAIENSMPMHRRLNILTGIANGLTLLHSRNFAHLDLKPQNILIDVEGVPKISDLGLSKKVRADAPISKAGYTLLYSAPEQVEGKTVDLSSDIWAFGNVMYYVFFNKGPNEYLKDPSDNIHSFVVKKNVVNALTLEKRKPLIPDRYAGLKERPLEMFGFELRYPKLVDLMRMCWQLDARVRPAARKIAKILTKIYSEELKIAEGNPDLESDLKTVIRTKIQEVSAPSQHPSSRQVTREDLDSMPDEKPTIIVRPGFIVHSDGKDVIASDQA